MKEQIAVQSLLREHLHEIQRQNPRYSMRAYAKKLGVHVGALSNILNGKRNVSLNLADRITQRLMLDPQRRSEVLSLFPTKRQPLKAGTAKFEPRYLELTASQFKIAAEWEHFAVMSLVNCGDFDGTRESVSKRLGITDTRASHVIDRLLKLEILETSSAGKLSRSKKNFRTLDDVAELSLKKHHEETLDLAKDSLHRDAVQRRDFSSITMAIDIKKLSTAKALIRKFQDELSDLLETGRKTEVYRLSVQLFPLTKIETGKLK